MATMSLEKMVRGQAQHSESIKNDETREFDDGSFPVGAVSSQGDLYIVRLDQVPAFLKERQDTQLAEGTTQGARHVLTQGACFTAVPGEVVSQIKRTCGVAVDARYVGPVIKSLRGRMRIDHPEHGDHVYKGDMICAVVYQRSLDSEEREARVRD